MSEAVLWIVFGIVTNSVLIVLHLQTIREWKRSSESWARLCREQNDNWLRIASEMAEDYEHENCGAHGGTWNERRWPEDALPEGWVIRKWSRCHDRVCVRHCGCTESALPGVPERI